MKAAVLTVSDGVHHGTREDRSGETLEELLRADGFEVTRVVVPDERDEIAAAVAMLSTGASLVITTGGTGFAPRDVTPEATVGVIERAAPGIAEAIREDARRRTPHALLSRGVAGLVGATLVVNLPGSPGGCRDGYAVLRPALAARARARSGRARDDAQADVSAHALSLPRRFARLIRFEHTVFALPFAYVGALLSVDGWPGWASMAWVTVAMVGARTLAMSLNRLVDAELDARNPRTASRELPSGALTRTQVWALCVAALGVYLVAVFSLDPIVRWLWPIPVALFVAYPYLKRLTWLCHLWLGACLGLAPPGAWLAVTGYGALGSVGARRGRHALGGGLRPLLLALRSRARPGRGPALVGDALRRDRRLSRRTGAARADRRRACASQGGGSASARGTGWALPWSRRCSSTSTCSSDPATCGGSTRRSSPSTA